MDDPRGYYDEKNRMVCPFSTSTWEGLSGTTWDTWTEWAYSVEPEIIWFTDAIQLGLSPQTVNLKITCVSTGQVSYKVYTSDLGLFGGEETEHVIPHGATNVPAFTGKYIMVVVYSQEVNGETVNIREITVKTEAPKTTEYQILDLDSSTCAGTINSRVIPLPSRLENILDIKITPREVAAYPLDVYVANTATSTYVVPKIISKNSSAPTFALVGMDNHPRDAVVDITLKSSKNGYMQGNNLVQG